MQNANESSHHTVPHFSDPQLMSTAAATSAAVTTAASSANHAAASTTVIATASAAPSSTAAATAAPSSCWPYILPLPPNGSDNRVVHIPPLSFSLVTPGIFRSACPSGRNYAFLSTLDLRSVVYLCSGQYPKAELEHFTAQQIDVHCFAIEGSREPFVSIDSEALARALLCVVDTRNQPVLVHCTKGKHRTGVLIGVLRRLAGHSLSSAFAEYTQFIGASSASRDLDRLAIETFDVRGFKAKLTEEVPKEFRADWIV